MGGNCAHEATAPVRQLRLLMKQLRGCACINRRRTRALLVVCLVEKMAHGPCEYPPFTMPVERRGGQEHATPEVRPGGRIPTADESSRRQELLNVLRRIPVHQVKPRTSGPRTSSSRILLRRTLTKQCNYTICSFNQNLEFLKPGTLTASGRPFRGPRTQGSSPSARSHKRND